MPIYEYACQDCGHLFDVLQKMSDAALTECPECGQLELKKLVSAPNFRLKGSGWYETDFKKDKRRNLAGDAGKSDGGGKSESKSTDKSADKSADKKSEAKSKSTGSGSSGKSAGAD